MNRKTAFTMVELMLSIVILGVLAAIAGISYNSYIRKAKTAQAYQNIDALTKAEVSYFMSNKSFQSLNFNPLDEDGRLPSKTPLPLKSAADLSALGNPLMPGSNQYFMNLVFVGHTDGAGDELNVADCSSVTNCFIALNMGDPMLGGTKMILYSGQADSKTCEFVPILNYIQPQGKPFYNWAMVVAAADMREGNDENLERAKCTMIFKFLDTNANGKVNAAAPIIALNPGE